VASTAYLYDLYEAESGKIVCWDQTKSEIILFLGEDINLSNYIKRKIPLHGGKIVCWYQTKSEIILFL